MKFRTTRTEMYSNYGANNIVKVGYCDLQTLLNYEHPIAYTCGAQGWNSDIYELPNGVIISTGYNPIGRKKLDYNFIKSYEEKAKEIIYNGDWEKREEKLGKLILKFTEEIKAL